MFSPKWTKLEPPFNLPTKPQGEMILNKFQLIKNFAQIIMISVTIDSKPLHMLVMRWEVGCRWAICWRKWPIHPTISWYDLPLFWTMQPRYAKLSKILVPSPHPWTTCTVSSCDPPNTCGLIPGDLKSQRLNILMQCLNNHHQNLQ